MPAIGNVEATAADRELSPRRLNVMRVGSMSLSSPSRYVWTRYVRAPGDVWLGA